MKKIKVAINGAHGKMGAQAVDAVNEDHELELVGALEKSDNLGNTILDAKADVVIDFTTAEFAYENTKTIIELGAHPVIGTTGFNPAQIQELTDMCADLKRGAIIAPNFSIGALLMMRMAKECVQYFPHVEIIEMHHDRKADAPSGTSIKTAELIAENRVTPEAKVDEKELIDGARGGSCNDIPVHSVRLPGLVAHQQVIFGGTGETLNIKHDTINRSAFMPGVVLSCKKVIGLNSLVYGLENLLFDAH